MTEMRRKFHERRALTNDNSVHSKTQRRKILTWVETTDPLSLWPLQQIEK